MNFNKDFFEGDMADTIEGGVPLAWRLLATLEGGTLLLATSALIVYTVRNKLFQQTSYKRNVRSVLMTNTTNSLGRELKRRLEAQECVVETVPVVTSDACSRAINEARSADKNVDAILVVGAASKTNSLDGMASLVTEDVYDNLKLLESISSQVQPGGYIAWACVRDKRVGHVDTYKGAEAAFDTVLQASLMHLAKMRNCNPVWVGRCEEVEQAAERIVTALLIRKTEQLPGFSVRNTAHRISEFFDRWLKIVT